MTQTIPAALRKAAREFGTAPALAEPDGPRFTYADLLEHVRTAARAFIASGLRPGDRLAIWAPNTHHWVLAALGASYAGATLVPVNTRYTGHEALDVVHRSGARGLVVTGPFLGVDRLASLRDAASAEDLPLPGFIVSLPEWDSFVARADAVPADEADARAAAVRPDDLSDILFTSGTTGRSKGAMSAHRQALSVATSWAAVTGLAPTDRYLVINPFFHSFGLKAGILACLSTGAAMVPQPVFDAARALELIAAERITVLPGAPTVFTSLLDHPDRARHDLSTLRLAVTGATTVPPSVVERIRDDLGFDTVLTGYGLTEAVVATMCRAGDDIETVAYTCGRAAGGMEVRIGEQDEVLLRGPNVMLGYLDDKAATDEAIDPDGWLHTGDVGRLDAGGNLVITDRLKDMYICGGFNVYPAEVERELSRLPGVAESAVVGVPDQRMGEVGMAYVVPRPGHDLTENDVLAFCRGRLANYKVPRVVAIRAELPHNASGKVLKYLLREETSR